MEQMEQMEKSTAGAKVTWFIIGAIIALIAGFLIWGTGQAGGQTTRCSVDEFRINITLCTDLARISDPGSDSVSTCIDQVLDTCGFGGKPGGGL